MPFKRLITHRIGQNLAADQTNILGLPEWNSQNRKTFILILNAEKGTLYLSVKDPHPPQQRYHHFTLTQGLQSGLEWYINFGSCVMESLNSPDSGKIAELIGPTITYKDTHLPDLQTWHDPNNPNHQIYPTPSHRPSTHRTPFKAQINASALCRIPPLPQ